MNFDEALDILSPLRNPEAWRRDDDHFDHQQFPGQGRFTSGPPGQMSFPPVSGIKFGVIFMHYFRTFLSHQNFLFHLSLGKGKILFWLFV